MFYLYINNESKANYHNWSRKRKTWSDPTIQQKTIWRHLKIHNRSKWQYSHSPHLYLLQFILFKCVGEACVVQQFTGRRLSVLILDDWKKSKDNVKAGTWYSKETLQKCTYSVDMLLLNLSRNNYNKQLAHSVTFRNLKSEKTQLKVKVGNTTSSCALRSARMGSLRKVHLVCEQTSHVLLLFCPGEALVWDDSSKPH